MKVRTYVLLASMPILMMAFGTKNAIPTEGLNPGDLAPRIKSLENETSIHFQNHSGRYTLVNFWAAYNAESRARNVQLANEIDKFSVDRVALYSFSLDEKESIFTETVKADKLDIAKQFHAEQGKESVLYKQFNRKGGFSNYLINDKGIIVAKNVTPDKLAEVLRSI